MNGLLLGFVSASLIMKTCHFHPLLLEVSSCYGIYLVFQYPYPIVLTCSEVRLNHDVQVCVCVCVCVGVRERREQDT